MNFWKPIRRHYYRINFDNVNWPPSNMVWLYFSNYSVCRNLPNLIITMQVTSIFLTELFFSVRILPQTYWPILPDNLGCINKLHCVFRTFGETAYLIRPVQVWFLVAQPQKRGECSTIKQPGRKAEKVHQTREATSVWNQHDHGNKCLVRIRRTKTKINKI